MRQFESRGVFIELFSSDEYTTTGEELQKRGVWAVFLSGLLLNQSHDFGYH
jgi:hypothetical protein